LSKVRVELRYKKRGKRHGSLSGLGLSWTEVKAAVYLGQLLGNTHRPMQQIDAAPMESRQFAPQRSPVNTAE
jgi:hypothetical protein